MKSHSFGIILLLCIVGYFAFARGGLFDFGGDEIPAGGLRGTYQIEQESTPVHGLRFLDEKRVENLANGQVAGPMCTYVVDGKRLVLTHSCGTSAYKLHDGVLRDQKTGWTYRKAGGER